MFDILDAWLISYLHHNNYMSNMTVEIIYVQHDSRNNKTLLNYLIFIAVKHYISCYWIVHLSWFVVSKFKLIFITIYKVYTTYCFETLTKSFHYFLLKTPKDPPLIISYIYRCCFTYWKLLRYNSTFI